MVSECSHTENILYRELGFLFVFLSNYWTHWYKFWTQRRDTKQTIIVRAYSSPPRECIPNHPLNFDRFSRYNKYPIGTCIHSAFFVLKGEPSQQLVNIQPSGLGVECRHWTVAVNSAFIIQEMCCIEFLSVNRKLANFETLFAASNKWKYAHNTKLNLV